MCCTGRSSCSGCHITSRLPDSDVVSKDTPETYKPGLYKQRPGRLLHKKLANEAYIAHHLVFRRLPMESPLGVES